MKSKVERLIREEYFNLTKSKLKKRWKETEQLEKVLMILLFLDAVVAICAALLAIVDVFFNTFMLYSIGVMFALLLSLKFVNRKDKKLHSEMEKKKDDADRLQNLLDRYQIGDAEDIAILVEKSKRNRESAKRKGNLTEIISSVTIPIVAVLIALPLNQWLEDGITIGGVSIVIVILICTALLPVIFIGIDKIVYSSESNKWEKFISALENVLLKQKMEQKGKKRK